MTRETGPERKWTVFTRSIVAVLAGSIVFVTAAVSSIAVWRILALAKSDESRKASDLASFIARTAFVPVSLEDQGMLETAVSPYLDDPDLVYLTVKDAGGRTLLSRTAPPGRHPSQIVEVVHPVAAPAESSRPGRRPAPIGTVEVGLSLERAFLAVRAAEGWIAASAALPLAAAIGAGLWLISGMTARLKSLVGEARLSAELKAANDQLEAFSYSVAHDLRSPLRAINGFARLIEQDYAPKLDDEGRRLFGVVRDNARRMGEMIDDLLAFSKLGRTELRKTDVDLESLAREVYEQVRGSARTPPEIRMGALPRAPGDPDVLRQVFQNLLGNAVKYSSKVPRPMIEVGGRRERGVAIYFVKDNGAGFDMRYADKLFRVFQRLHSREEFEGTGVGLAIVDRIVQKHGGKVWAESKVGEGATFYFSLPLEGKYGGKN